MGKKSELIEKIEDSMCDIIDHFIECKSSDGISCKECLGKYAQIIVDNNLDNSKNRYNE